MKFVHILRQGAEGAAAILNLSQKTKRRKMIACIHHHFMIKICWAQKRAITYGFFESQFSSPIGKINIKMLKWTPGHTLNVSPTGDKNFQGSKEGDYLGYF